MRFRIASLLLVFAAGSLAALGADPATPKDNPRAKKAANPAAPTRGAESADEREAAALAFVRENHPELASLLEQLKAMKPDQYERAIAELSQVSRSLANMKKNNEPRYRAALDVWKAKSRAELLAAELAGTTGEGQQGALRAAVETQLAAELRQQRLEREIAAERLRSLDDAIKRLETRRDDVVQSRVQALLKKGQRARRAEGGQGTPSRTAVKKGEDRG